MTNILSVTLTAATTIHSQISRERGLRKLNGSADSIPNHVLPEQIRRVIVGNAEEDADAQ